MRKRLLVLDLVLTALVVLLGARVRQNWLEARKRERVGLGQPLKPVPAPRYAPLPALQPLKAADYSEIAQKMLFGPDRNPTVVVEVAPPKPMPELPFVYGVVNLGEGPLAIMSVKSGAPHEEFRTGEEVGEFKLVAVSSEEITLEWEGKQVTKKIEALLERNRIPAGGAAGAAQRTASPAAPQAAATPVASASGPGTEVGANLRSCQPGDTAPSGTVSGGYRKVVRDSPFGKMCQWEAAK